MRSVLVVDDNEYMLECLLSDLRRFNYNVFGCTNVEDAINLIKTTESTSNPFDIVIMDCIFDNGTQTGPQAASRVRMAGCKTPIIFLSVLSSEQTKVNALHAGGDDYLVKPWLIHELQARLEAVIRRSKGHASSIFRLGNLRVDFAKKECSIIKKKKNNNNDNDDESNNDSQIKKSNNDQIANSQIKKTNNDQNDDSQIKKTNKDDYYIVLIPLTNKEYQMLELMCLCGEGAIIGKEKFITHLYESNQPSEPKIIDVFMCKLRSKISAVNNGINYISTVWGRGYTLTDQDRATNNNDDVVNIDNINDVRYLSNKKRMDNMDNKYDDNNSNESSNVSNNKENETAE